MTVPLASALELLILQPGSFCNLDCSYCYLPGRDKKNRMSQATLEAAAARVFSSPYLGESLSVIWHAGEPLAVPRSWYETAFETFRRANGGRTKVVHHVQTNATLLDRDWAEFLRDHDVRLGISLDGPRDLHDARRRDRAGRGSFDKVMTGIGAARAAGLKFHILSVLTAASLDRADELFAFYCENGIDHVCYNIEEIEGTNQTSSLSDCDARTRVESFFRRMGELVAADGERLLVRELRDARAALLCSPLSPGAQVNHQARPLAILTVGSDGGLSTLSPELIGVKAPMYDDFVFGNVHEHGLDQISASPVLLRLMAEVETGIERCRAECEYFPFCLGGSPGNKYFETGTFTGSETLYCRLAKMAVLDAALAGLETSAPHPARKGGSHA